MHTHRIRRRKDGRHSERRWHATQRTRSARPGAYQDELGRIRVPNTEGGDEASRQPLAAVHARVAIHEPKDDRTRRAGRMIAFANARGLSVVTVVEESPSGVDDSHPRLTKRLGDEGWGTLIVEHEDRPSRVGFRWSGVLPANQDQQIPVADAVREETADLMDDFVSLTHSFAARLHGTRSARRRTDQILATLGAQPLAPQVECRTGSPLSTPTIMRVAPPWPTSPRSTTSWPCSPPTDRHWAGLCVLTNRELLMGAPVARWRIVQLHRTRDATGQPMVWRCRSR